MNNSQQIRREIRARRRTLSPREQRCHSQSVCQRLLRWMPFLRAESVAIYFSADGEVDLMPVAESAWSMGKVVYLPVLHPFAGNRLWFSRWDAKDTLVRNRFNILEPNPRRYKPRHGLKLDMVLMPLVAFNPSCARLGMGGGFYDRTFAFRVRNKVWRRPLLVGIAHDLQCVSALQSNDWDVPLDAVVTEHQHQVCKK